jgi:hypothetical protein
MVNETDIVELELKSKRFSLTLKKKAALQAAEPIIQVNSLAQQHWPKSVSACTNRRSVCNSYLYDA